MGTISTDLITYVIFVEKVDPVSDVCPCGAYGRGLMGQDWVGGESSRGRFRLFLYWGVVYVRVRHSRHRSPLRRGIWNRRASLHVKRNSLRRPLTITAKVRSVDDRLEYD